MPDGSRTWLAAGTAFCVCTSMIKYIGMFASPMQHTYHEFLPLTHTLIGVFAMLILLAYPVSVARPWWFTWRRAVLYFLPSVLPLLIFLLPEIHLIYSRAQMVESLAYPDVWLRLLMVPVTLIYCFGFLSLLTRDGVRREGNWLRAFIYGALIMAILVCTFMVTHWIVFHYVHQLYVALFYSFFTWYEIERRTFVSPVVTHAEEDQSDAGRVRFELFDSQVESRRLFTQQDINREQLCAIMGVDRNRFAAILRTHSGCKNMSDYLNRKRVTYAITLMRQHPEYTLQAISEEAGFRSVSTFNRAFRDRYGCAPSEFAINAD